MKSLLQGLSKHRLASAFALLAVLSVAVLGFSFAAHGVRGQEQQVSSTDATPLKVVNSPVAPNEFVKIAKAVGPAVVNINTQTLPKQSAIAKRRQQHRVQPQNPDDEDDQNGSGNQGGDQGGIPDFFYKFFGGQGQGQDGEDDGQTHESLGSGFIVDPKGYIITNNHVIDHADKIYVKLSTDPDSQDDFGRPAHVIGVDKATDLAVIKIDTDKPLPTVKLGNSDSTQVGDWVEAIGSPFALSQTVTAGIISAENRTIEPGQAGQFQHFIQTDAAINPGNSGGPLLNMNGEVIGVNTAIYTQSAGYQGIGFALPANTVVAIYNDLIGPTHKVVRGSIGISFKEDNSSAVYRMYGNGVIVTLIQPDGPADKAGLKMRDVIVSIDGRKIKDGDDLVNDIASRRPGSSARLGYIRDGQPGTATVVIGDRDRVFSEKVQTEDSPAPDDKANPGESKLGISVREISPDTSNKIHSSGVLITGVLPGSFADLHGLEPGLVIVRVNKQPSGTRDQFNTLVGKLKSGDDVVLEIIDPHRPADGIIIIGGTL